MLVDAYTNKPSVSIPRLNPPQIALQNIPKLQQDQIDAFSKSAKSKEKVVLPAIKKKKDTVTRPVSDRFHDSSKSILVFSNRIAHICYRNH